MELRPAGPCEVDGMQQLASRMWPSGRHPGGLGWGLSRDALADALVVAVDADGSVVGFAGRGGDEITHAWKPSSIPYIDGRPVDPHAESSFTAEAYESVHGAWLYDPALDLVAVDAGDGRFGACCIAWWDPSTGVCEIEPLGVVPEHRRRGLAIGLCLEVAGLVADRGGTQVFINAQPQPGYVASTSAYLAAGFQLLQRATTYALPHRE